MNSIQGLFSPILEAPIHPVNRGLLLLLLLLFFLKSSCQFQAPGCCFQTQVPSGVQIGCEGTASHVPRGLSSAPARLSCKGCGQTVPLLGGPCGWKTRDPFRKLYFLVSRQSCRPRPGLRRWKSRADARLSDAQPWGPERHGAWSWTRRSLFSPQPGSEQAWC